jgi:hypothetical protein
MKLGLISLNVPGHLNLETALVRQLQARNNTDVTELTASWSDTAIDLFGVRRRPPSKFEETAKETEIERRHRKALCSLISLAVLISLLVGILWLMESATPRKAGSEQLDVSAESAQIQGEVTLGQALRALSVRH